MKEKIDRFNQDEQLRDMAYKRSLNQLMHSWISINNQCAVKNLQKIKFTYTLLLTNPFKAILVWPYYWLITIATHFSIKANKRLNE